MAEKDLADSMLELDLEEELFQAVTRGPLSEHKGPSAALEDVDARDVGRRPVLHAAVRAGGAEGLLGMGADPGLRDGKASKAVEAAKESTIENPEDRDRHKILKLVKKSQEWTPDTGEGTTSGSVRGGRTSDPPNVVLLQELQSTASPPSPVGTQPGGVRGQLLDPRPPEQPLPSTPVKQTGASIPKDASLLRESADSMGTEMATLVQQFLSLKEALDEAKRELSPWNADLGISETEVTSLEIELEIPKAKGTFLENDLEISEAEGTSLGIDLEIPKAEVTSLENDLEIPKAKVTFLENDLQISEPEGTSLGIDLEIPKAEVTSLGIDLEIPKAEVTFLENDLQISEPEGTSLEIDLEIPKAKGTFLENDLEIPKAEVTSLENDLEIPKSEVTSLENDLEISEAERTSLGADCRPLMKSLDELKRNAQKVLGELEELKQLPSESLTVTVMNAGMRSRRECIAAMMRNTKLQTKGERTLSWVRGLYERLYSTSTLTSCLLAFLQYSRTPVKVKVYPNPHSFEWMKQILKSGDGFQGMEDNHCSFTDLVRLKVYLGGSDQCRYRDDVVVAAAFANSLARVSMYLGFRNRGKPYSRSDERGERKYQEIIKEAGEKMGVEGGEGLDAIIGSALNKKTQLSKEIGLIAVVPGMIARYGSTDGRARLRRQLPSLLRYYEDHVMATLVR